MTDGLAVRNAYRAEYWAKIIQECESSGLTKRAFCQQHGISEKSYYYWMWKLRNELAEKAVPQLVQLEPESASNLVEYYSCTYACDRCEKDTGFAHIVATKTLHLLLQTS